MKILKGSFLKPALCALFAFTAVSCTNELTWPTDTNPSDSTSNVKPVKSPEFYAWTGQQNLSATSRNLPSATIAATRSSNVGVNSNFFKICDFGGGKSEWMQQQYPDLYEYFDNAPATTDRGEYVSQHEYDVVMAYLKAHPDEGSTVCNLSTYFIQNVGTSYDEYNLDYLADDGSVHHSQSVKGYEKMNYLTIDGAHIPDYNATDGKRALVVNVPVNSPTYNDSYGDQEQTKTNAYRFYYIEVDGVMNCYLCFDYQTKKYDNGMLDYNGDKVFSDWVIKLVPADGSAIEVPEDNGNKPVVPETPVVDPEKGISEVEINLSILDSHEDYTVEDLVSKLSIHVRHATDVEVFIPVPARYYCAMDDLDIVLSHERVDEIYGAESKAEYEVIPGHKVTVTVTFEENGIRVVTDGIDQEIIDFCRETYGDGINFEIWTYFNNEVELDGVLQNAISREVLQQYLNQTTVKFLDSTPDMYINAFNDIDETGEKFPGDCVVSIVSDQRNEYGEMSEGYHYNGSPYNEIYTKEEI